MTPGTYGIIRWLTSITRPVHGPLVMSAMLRCLNLSLDLALFGLVGWTTAAAATGHPASGMLWWIMSVAIAKALAYYGEQFTGHYVAFKALELLRGHAFGALWPQAPAVVFRNRSGDLLPTLTRDVDRIEVVYAHTFAPVFSAFVVPTVAVVTAGATLDWAVVVVPAFCVALALFVVPFIGLQRSFDSTARMLELRRALAAHVTDSVFGIDEVVSYGRQKQRTSEQDELGAQICQASLTPTTCRGLRRAFNLALMLVSTASVVWSGIHSALDPMIVAGLAAASLRLFEGPRGIEDAVGYLDHSLGAARRLWELCHSADAVTDGPRELQLDGAPQIEWRDVTYSYPGADPDTPALAGLSATAPAGGRTVFMGRSGSGKSTAAQLLLRFDELNGGDIMINGVSAREFTLDSLRREIILVPQRAQVLDATIAENLRLGAPEATDEQLWSALETAELADEIHAMPMGLATPTGRDGRELSGGQLQRLCLARALLMHPKALVLDEFTANLNPSLEARVRDNLDRSFPNLTIIEITHRLENIGEADRVVEFDRGHTVVCS